MRQVIYRTKVRLANPISVRMASALGALLGTGINGGSGTVRYGMAEGRQRFTGYAFPPQIFLGWNPLRVAAGAPRVAPPRLPGTSSPASLLASPLTRATAAITNQQTTHRN